jgi:hypothetical protein
MSRARVRAPTENRTRAATDDARASGRRDEVFWLGKARKKKRVHFFVTSRVFPTHFCFSRYVFRSL